MPLTEKQRRSRGKRRSGYAVFETGRAVRKKRSGIGSFLVLVFLLATLGGLGAHHFSASSSEETNDGSQEQRTYAPSVERTPQKKVAQEEDAGKAAPGPEDPTLYLTVPRLGLYDNTVRNDRSEETMGLGAIKLPKTDFPWQTGDTNTYIACHRLGFPGTESYNQCLNLPSMRKGDPVTLKDANGTVYNYRVSEILTVSPEDSWVTEPVKGREMVSLQTCIENVGDFYTLGPNWSARIVVRADRVS